MSYLGDEKCTVYRLRNYMSHYGRCRRKKIMSLKLIAIPWVRRKKKIKSQCPLGTMQARTGWLWGERTTKIIHKSKLQSVAGVATKLLGKGKGYFLSVWRENKQNAAVFHLTHWIILVTWRRKKPFAGRNEEYPIENSRANTQQGPKKKSGCAKSPRQKTPGKKKRFPNLPSCTYSHLR